jgi:hypothetical protein
MSKSPKDRIADSFSGDTQEKAFQYLEWLRACINDVYANMRRSSGVTLVLAAIFELVVSSKRLELSIGSFRISGGSVVLVFIPAVIAYSHLQAITDFIRLIELRNLHIATFNKWLPEAEQYKLHRYIFPPQAVLLNIGNRPVSEQKALRQMQRALESQSFILLVFGRPVFIGIAYWQLYLKHIDHNIPWAASLCLSLIWIGIAFLYFAGWGLEGIMYKETQENGRS